MAEVAHNFLSALDDKVTGILDACTACGDCVRICPTPAITGNDVRDGEAVAGGILDILRGGEGMASAERFAQECCGSGHCLSVCEAGINPRFMLAMAKRALTAKVPEADRREKGKLAFKTMSRSVRVLSRLQLPPELMERLSPSSHPARDVAPDIVFYTGCNMLKTPHIGLLCLDVLDRLGISYEVHGGPSSCCGILQMRPGDAANAGRQAGTTVARFAASGAASVVTWCPTCQIQMGETVLPAAPQPFDMSMFPVFLASRLEDLRPHLTGRVEKRVALHEYPGTPGVVESVLSILGAIPGLEVIDLGLPGIGYQMTSLAGMPDFRRSHVAETLRRAESRGATTLAGIYHADHRELAAHEGQWPFEIVNYMDLVGESLGLDRPDVFKRLKLMQDADAVMAAAGDLVTAHGMDPEEVRDAVLKDLLGEQHLPIDRARHPI